MKYPNKRCPNCETDMTFASSDSDVSGWQDLFYECEKCNITIYIYKIEEGLVMRGKANWIIWAGWRGNHDQRIDDAKCSKCGYKHFTVYNSPEKLSNYCPNCGSKMSIEEK